MGSLMLVLLQIDFFRDSVVKKSLKIGQYLTKLYGVQTCAIFFWGGGHPVCLAPLVKNTT